MMDHGGGLNSVSLGENNNNIILYYHIVLERQSHR